ncbi:MAG: hypothetical protein RMK80_01160 [Pseudobdellovibrionaceae bacterium]|nr:hypothetical protein [Pseudobdellovibrionaceae bacterium]
MSFYPLRSVDSDSLFFRPGDTLVLVGELFDRGYANGLVQAALRRGMRVIEGTVGRRDENHGLRPLREEELKEKKYEWVNIPLEAGFEWEVASDGLHLMDRLKELKLAEWESFSVPKDLINESRIKGEQRLFRNLQNFCAEIEKRVPSGNILFAHLMAGGVPKNKVVLSLLNRVVRGTGEKFLSSKKLWDSPLGWVINENFKAVTAWSFQLLLEASSELREKMMQQGRIVAYSAYGYHGTEIFISGQLRWQSYAPYLQGWAKLLLEDLARKARQQGILATVFNCPEILTHSSSIFQGVEVPLYPLWNILWQYGNHPFVRHLEGNCQMKLKSGVTLSEVVKMCEQTYAEPDLAILFDFARWPQHNEKQQLEKLISVSDHIMQMHENPKNLLTFDLSEVVLEACGEVMLKYFQQYQEPVVWIGHDLVGSEIVRLKNQ